MSQRLPADQRRQQLLKAALEIAESSGLGAVTVRGVAERAGVSLGVVHYCFTDKEELISELIGIVNNDTVAAGDAFASVDIDSGRKGMEGLRTRLADAMELIWAVTFAAPDRQLLTYEIVSYSLRTHGLPEIGLATSQYESYEAIIRDVLQRSAKAAGMTYKVDDALLVRTAMSCIDGSFLRWQLDRDDETAKASIMLLVDMFCQLAVEDE